MTTKYYTRFFLWHLIILYLFIQKGYSQLNHIYFKNFSVESGLPTKSITSIIEDSTGFIWMGSSDGLFRYDGYEFQGNFIENVNNINHLMLDNDELWVCGKSLYRYWIKKDTFENYKNIAGDPTSLPNNMIGSMIKDSQGRYWVGHWDGLSEFIPKTNTFVNYMPDSSKTPNGCNYIVDICEDSNNNLWLATWTSIYYFDTKTKLLTRKFNQLNDTRNRCLYLDNENNLWVGSWNKGLQKIDLNTNHIKKYVFSNINQTQQINSIFCDSKNNFWIGTENGIILLDRKTDKFKLFNPDMNTLNMSTKLVKNIFEDSGKGIWIGSSDGVAYFNLVQEAIKDIPYRTGNKVQKNIFLSNKEEIYISGESTDLYDENGNIKVVNKLPIVFRSRNDHFCFIENNNTFLVSKAGNPSVIEHKFYIHNKPFNLLSSQIIFDDLDNNIWIEFSDYFMVLNLSDGTQKNVPLSDFVKPNSEFEYLSINNAYIDNANRLWLVISPNILYCFDRNLKQLKVFDRSKYNYGISITKFYEDTEHNICMIAGNGIYRYNSSTDKFVHLSENFHLPSLKITGITDNKNEYWLSSNKGIFRLNKHSQRFRNYSIEHGLKNENVFGIHARKSDGKIIFGNQQYLSFIDTSMLVIKKKHQRTLITRFWISNMEIFADKESPLKKRIEFTDTIILDYTQNALSFQLACLNYMYPTRNTFCYKLEGFDKNWISNISNNRIIYNKLSPGTYVLNIRSKINDNPILTKNQQLTIIIHPPFWQTWWFRIIFIISILVTIVIVFRLRLRSLKIHQQELERQVEERTREILSQKKEIETQAEELIQTNQILHEHKEELIVKSEQLEKTNQELTLSNSTKDKLFSIIAHDLRNPFHAIVGFSDLLINNQVNEVEISEYVEKIKKSALSASLLLENLLQWARTQTDRIQCNLSILSVNDIILENIRFFEMQCKQKNIVIHFTSKQNLNVIADADMLNFIVRNILNNAIKFTYPKGQIYIHFRVKNNDATIEIEDNGMGMDASTIEKLFSANNVQSQGGTAGEKGTGLGLMICKEFIDRCRGKITVDSSPGNGSRFNITLPLANENHKIDPVQESIIPAENEPSNIILDKDKSSILIVDDEEEIRKTLKVFLSKIFIVYEAKDGKEALDIASDKLPEIIVSDWMMPEMTGMELCEAIKSDDRTAHIPFILLTGKTDTNDQLMGLESGADDYITKPFDNRLLMARVRAILENRKRIRDKFFRDYIINDDTKQFNQSDVKFIRKTQELIEANIDNTDFDVVMLANGIGMSRSQLHSRLTATTGQPASEYIRTIRLKKAASLLISNDLNINEVVNAVGFHERTHFSRSFTKLFGLSPSEYKKKFKK